MSAVQAQANAITAPSAGVANGLQTGGIVPDSGLSMNGVAAPVTTWTGAATPVQSGPVSSPTVTVRQTAQSALLNWRTLNVGTRTTLKFDQSAGGAAAPTWVALNRVQDPNLAPTQILGHVEAAGHVIVVNGSGVIFGPNAQVTVGSLIASTASISDAQFTTRGIYSADGRTPSWTGANAPVVVEQGASITTNQPLTATSAGGGVILLGSAVTNAGDIHTPDGQTILAAGRDFVLQQGYGVSGTGSPNGLSGALIGNLTNQDGFGPAGTVVETVQGSAIAVADGGGAVTNTGLIEARTGDVTMVGETVTQAGVIAATSSVSTRGTIHLLTDQADTGASVTLAPGSVTSILPDTDSNTALDAQRATDVSNSANADVDRADNAPPLNDEPVLPDNQYQSLIQVVSGNNVDVGAGALAMSQGGQIQIAAPGRVLVESGAQLDVSGEVGVSLPMSANQVAVNVQGFELRDDPLNRDTTLLNNANIDLDVRTLVTAPANSDAANSPYTETPRLYSPSGLFEVSGEVSNISHTIGEWVSAGGTILISGGSSGQVVAQPGSVFNLAGGSIDYQAGRLGLTWLVGPDGRLYNAETAPANLVYTGVYGGFTVSHPRWNVTQTFNDPGLTPTSVEVPGYVEGRDGGVLEISEPTVVLEGTVDAGVIAGPLQTQPHETAITDPYLQPQNVVPLAGQLMIGEYGGLGYGSAGIEGGYPTMVTFQAGGAPIAAGLGAAGTGLSTPLPSSRVGTAVLDTRTLDEDGLGGLSVATSSSITVASPLTVGPNATLALNGAHVEIDADVRAPAGTASLGDVLTLPSTIENPATGFSLTPAPLSGETVAAGGAAEATASVTVAPGVTIDLRGTWTNLLADPVDVAGEATQAGGSLSVDTTGSITLGARSLMDVSAGAVVSPSGALSGGAAGSVTLIGDNPSGNPAFDTGTEVAAMPVALMGMITSEGVSGGGTFTLRAPGVVVAASASTTGLDAQGRTVLTTADFQRGFSTYVIDGYGSLPAPGAGAGGRAPTPAGVEIDQGVAIDPRVPVYLEQAGSLIAPTGSNPETAASSWLPPLYLQNQNTATLTERAGASVAFLSRTFSPAVGTGSVVLDGGGGISIDHGASVAVDPGQTVTVEALGQITIHGAITAPGSTGGGGITIQNDRHEVGTEASDALQYEPGLSIWIGSDAVLSATATAATAIDLFGRPYGVAPGGGSITIGGATDAQGAAYPVSTDASVVIRPGAVVEASGSAASIDLAAGLGVGATPDIVPIAGAGGSISLNSSSAIAIDGSLRALAGGPTASGGSLTIDLVAPLYGFNAGTSTFNYTVPDSLRIQREILVTQSEAPSALPASLAPGGQALSAILGTATISAEQVQAGGFSNLTLAGNEFAGFGPEDVRFVGDVALRTDGSIDLPALLTDAQTNARVSIEAPYVTLNANAVTSVFSSASPYTGDTAPFSTAATTSTLTVAAGQLAIGTGEINGIHVVNRLNTVMGETPTTIFDQPGFASASFSTTGDTTVGGIFTAGEALSITAAQIYPTTGNAVINLPADQNGTDAIPGGTLILARTQGARPVAPLSVGNGLSLFAGTIEQGGDVVAPLGTLSIGYGGEGGFFQPANAFTTTLTFLPGSVTSVSLKGQTVLYGGTQDGVAYEGATATLAPSINLAAQSVGIEAGSTVDLEGGGVLTGAGFNSGRGGSTDVLAAPFLQFSGDTATPAASDEVYAIVPAYSGTTQSAPTLAYDYASNVAPAAGSQVTISAGVSGLPAGTYTLQPAYDALLPGAFRIEIEPALHPLPGSGAPVGNLSTLVAGTPSTAGTPVTGTRPVGILLTSGADIRRLSSYDEETYSAFQVAQAQTFDYQRGFIPADAGTLTLNFNLPIAAKPLASAASTPALTVNGTVLLTQATGGRGGQADVVATSISDTNYTGFDIVGDDGPTSAQLAGTVVLRASDLDRLGADTLVVGGTEVVTTGAGSASGIEAGVVTFTLGAGDVTVSDGAVLSAPQVVLLGSSNVSVAAGGAVNTLGAGQPSFDSTDGFTFGNLLPNAGAGTAAPAVLAVSNGILDFIPPGSTVSGYPDQVSIENGALLASLGTVGIETGGAVSVGDDAVFASRRLSFAVSSVNVISSSGVPAGEVLPPGLDLTQARLNGFQTGQALAGAPKVEQISLLATQSVNFYGNVDFSLGGTGQTLELQTPSIYGAGAAGDVATITTGTFIWNGLAVSTGSADGVIGPLQNVAAGDAGTAYQSALAAPVYADGPGAGAGALVVDASDIVLGYAPGEIVLTPSTNGGRPVLSRNSYGFSSVTLNAGTSVTVNSSGTLSVYQSQGAYANGSYQNSGGALSIVTPLVTTQAGALLQISAGGAVAIGGTGGRAGTAAGLGGEIDVTGAAIDLSTAIELPEGKLSLTAPGDVAFGPGATIDLAGRVSTFFDQTVAGPGGVLDVESTTGSVTADPASTIDVSSPGGVAGTIAIAASAGDVSLEGAIAGAGGTPGGIDIRAGTLGDFAGLNQRLTAGGLTGSRGFEIGSGDLTIESGDEVRAANIDIAVDSGNLTIDGLIEASGAAPGTISLSAGGNLVLTHSAVLDAHGSVAQTDSTGASVDAENRSIVTLRVADGPNGTNLAAAGTEGTLTIAPGAAIDVSAAPGVTCASGPCGDVEIDVPRIGAADGTNGDLAISASGPVAIAGAGVIAVNGFWSYAPSDGLIMQTNAGVDPNGIGLDQVGAANTGFIASALPSGTLNATLAGKLAGLTTYANAFHLRPGVEIDSSNASGGDLTVVGDLDLSVLRAASLNPSSQLTSVYGSGEPGVLELRASDELHVYGSISDGFAQPVDAASSQNPDDEGWVLQNSAYSGAPIGQSVVVPIGAGMIDIGGSTLPAAGSVNYALPLAGGQNLLRGTTLPTSITLGAALTVPEGGVVAQGDVVAADGRTVLYAKGSVIAGGTSLAAGQTLGAGFVLFTQTTFQATNALTGQGQTWPAGASLAAFATSITGATVALAASAPLTAGDIIPAGTSVQFPSFAPSVPLRPETTLLNGLSGQGEAYAASNLLPAGSLSWSVTLAAGANTASADPTRLMPSTVLAASGATGDLTLSDLHYSVLLAPSDTTGPGDQPLAYLPSFSVIRTGTGSLSLLAGGTLDEATSYGIYTAGTQSPGIDGSAYDPRSANYTLSDPAEGVATQAQASVYDSIHAAYPTGGGDVTITAQDNLLTTYQNLYLVGSTAQTSPTGEWLDIQGNTTTQPGAWSITFGNYLPFATTSSSATSIILPVLVGFSGIGTLGGGNLTVKVGGGAGSAAFENSNNATTGQIFDADFNGYDYSYNDTSSLYLAVGGSGRQTANGVVVTGGGRLSLDVGGALDATPNVVPNAALPNETDSTILSLRGTVSIEAGSISSVNGQTFHGAAVDNPFSASIFNGPEIDLGDATATVTTRGDLSLGQSLNPGLLPTFDTQPDGSSTWFSLWQPNTSLSLFSASGDVSPALVTGTTVYYPPRLSVVAASGSIYELGATSGNSVLETAPSASGEIEFLAGASIVAGLSSNDSAQAFGPTIDISGADPSLLPSVTNPAFSGGTGAIASDTESGVDTLFAYSTDGATSFVHANDPQPIRFYAASGDIEDLSTGQIINATQYVGAKAVQIRAGNDIVNLDRAAQTGLFFNSNPTDISVISAGNDIYYANAQVSGPGLLEVSAGGNIDQTDTGTTGAPDPSTLVSLGYLVDRTVATQNAGAGITVTAGVQPGAINLAGFAELYFNPANLADATTPLQSQPGRVVRTYQGQLLAFMQARGYTGSASGALAAFLALPAEVQQILVLQTYYAELNQSGLDYADPSSRFYRSYLEGTDAIHTLFPGTDLTGRSAASGGSLTLTGNSGITTEFGGNIEIADPFGATTVGVPGPVPGASSGIITQGQGDVDVYSYGSVLLGQSRIFTTFGGNLLIWLEGNGEINGGQGSKSTIVFTPPNITYDPYADIALAPTVPSTGAGLATLAPVAGVAQGNINLISPFGTIDAGEAGIRSSGNINLVALTVVNAANVQAGGKVTGVTVTAAPNTAGITAASAAAGAVQNAAKNNVGTTAPQQTPSIITVEAVGQGTSQGGNEGGNGSSDDDRRRHKGKT